MSLRKKLEEAPDVPAIVEAMEASYTAGIESLGKVFLKTLDNWTGFNRYRNWGEQELGAALWQRCEHEIPLDLKKELSGNQVGMAAHLAYQAYITAEE